MVVCYQHKGEVVGDIPEVVADFQGDILPVADILLVEGTLLGEEDILHLLVGGMPQLVEVDMQYLEVDTLVLAVDIAGLDNEMLTRIQHRYITSKDTEII